FKPEPGQAKPGTTRFFEGPSIKRPIFSTAGEESMTDIGREAQFALAQTQLSVSSYFDEAIFAREQALIFKQSSLYAGHEKHVPEPGDWRTLPHEKGGRVLVRGAQGVELMSNVCRHRQAIMLGFNQDGAGNLRQTGGNIVCPVHRWTYSVQGKLL